MDLKGGLRIDKRGLIISNDVFLASSTPEHDKIFAPGADARPCIND
jgi:hypothetical protein